MAGRTANWTTIVLAVFTAIQVCFAASVAAGWHPWEQRPTPACPPIKTSADSSPAAAPLIGMVYFAVNQDALKRGLYSTKQCIRDARATFESMGFSDLKTQATFQETDSLTGSLNATKAVIDCSRMYSFSGGEILIEFAATDTTHDPGRIKDRLENNFGSRLSTAVTDPG